MQLRIKVEGTIVDEGTDPKPADDDPVTEIVHVEDDDDKPLEWDEEAFEADVERNRLPSATDGPAPQLEADAQPPETLLYDPGNGIQELAATQPDEDTQPQETLWHEP